MGNKHIISLLAFFGRIHTNVYEGSFSSLETVWYTVEVYVFVWGRYVYDGTCCYGFWHYNGLIITKSLMAILLLIGIGRQPVAVLLMLIIIASLQNKKHLRRMNFYKICFKSFVKFKLRERAGMWEIIANVQV